MRDKSNNVLSTSWSKFKKIPLLFRLLGVLILIIVCLFNFPRLQTIIYPLPESDGFSLVGHEAVVKVSDDGRDGILYKYKYCDPVECANKQGTEKITSRTYAYIERYLGDEKDFNNSEINSYFAVAENTDIVGNSEGCHLNSGSLVNLGCVLWYRVSYLTSNSIIFKFGGIKVFEQYDYGTKSYTTNVNNKDYFGLEIHEHTDIINKNFEAIYI